MPCNQFPSTQRHKAWGRITILFALIVLALTALPTASFAGTDTAGNILATDNDANPSGVEGDLYWAGQALNLDDASIDRDIIAAGDTLSIRDCTVGGAVRLAARTIDIAKTTVNGSVTVAGQHVVLNSDSAANCFYAMGETVALRGSAKSAALAGDTVTIDGTVEGDVEVWADKLVLGKNARITGTVNAHVSEDPERAAGAEVGALKIDRTENESAATTANNIIGGIVAAALSTCFVALLLELVFPRATASAAGMLHQRPTPLWVSGLLGTIAVVPAVLLLIISIAGLSLAGTLLCGVIGIALVSSAFAGCAIARMVGHSQNRYAMAAAGGVIAGALTAIPLVGDFISGVAFVFTLGYVIQIIWRNAHLKPQQPANTPELPTA
ncbi:polymer-forming cytoskeletal protein [Collinsella sp. BG-O-102]|uniref:polymer-forming cytoskeletal protein n=1 Tax=Collinsella sp. BG-O-102 TaxID=2949659 RepID=UPI00202E01B5|nr:polymer-forming cytoskeletal protein [Collinsella sp. BG-O-102]MCM0710268.1 polymer-forming cytoskeletal protein [Collinsella sp. BG-O-102]